MTRITEQLASLKSRINRAAVEAGRSVDSVTLLAVSKKKSAQAIRTAMQAGQMDFGENYVQEAVTKIADIDGGPVWHFIGALQSNKSRVIAEHFDWLHTLASEKLAHRLSKQRPADQDPLNVCLQVRPLDGGNRGGAALDQLEPLAQAVSDLPGLQLRGLMIMPMPDIGIDRTRAEFARVRQYAEDLARNGFSMDTLSMGMSADFELAIAEGSTIVRVGTGLFGARD